MRIGVIINPISGRGGTRTSSGDDRAARAREWMRHAGIDGDVELTRAAGHARELSRAFVDRAVDRVIAWGGDGTVNEVAGPLVHTPIALGIVPSGSGDGLARSLGLRTDPSAAFTRAISAAARPIDVGTMGPRHFLNVAGIGFDAAIAGIFNARTSRGGFGYVSGSLRSVWSYECRPYRLELDGEILTGSRFLVAFANGRQYGNGIVVAPDADLADGWLNAVVVAEGSALRQFWRARRLALARLRPAEGVLRVRVQRARVTGEHLSCHADGETFEMSGALEVGIAPQALLVARP